MWLLVHSTCARNEAADWSRKRSDQTIHFEDFRWLVSFSLNALSHHSFEGNDGSDPSLDNIKACLELKACCDEQTETAPSILSRNSCMKCGNSCCWRSVLSYPSYGPRRVYTKEHSHREKERWFISVNEWLCYIIIYLCSAPLVSKYCKLVTSVVSLYPMQPIYIALYPPQGLKLLAK